MELMRKGSVLITEESHFNRSTIPSLNMLYPETSVLNIIFTSFLYAMAATLYYKRSFKQEMLTIVVPLCTVGILLDLTGNTLLTILIILETVNIIRHMSDIMKSLNISLFFTLLIAIIDIRVSIFGSANWTACKMLLVAIPQFIRKPAGLKTRLQGVRSHLGPVFVMYSVKLAIMDHLYAGEFTCACMATAVMAGVLFRPDNGVILDLLGFQTHHQDRKTVHGRSMCVSLLCLLMSMAF